ncbi:hypothetical protein GOODEAATRI_006505 [Goodea atripinnis]|uniref:Uncharacterized protein n=1 Tax=Goodea atripinnis TaxID=208336 RepID=A0ABV0MFK2_9TELE
MSSSPKKRKKTHLYSASSTHSPASSTLTASHPPPQNGKARATRNTTPASAHKRNRADTTEQRAHNGRPDLTPRRDKLTQQSVPGRRHGNGIAPTMPPQPHKHTTSLPLQRQPREKHQPVQFHRHCSADPNANDHPSKRGKKKVKKKFISDLRHLSKDKKKKCKEVLILKKKNKKFIL